MIVGLRVFVQRRSIVWLKEEGKEREKGLYSRAEVRRSDGQRTCEMSLSFFDTCDDTPSTANVVQFNWRDR
jgi:hypothetical protein